MSLTKEQLELVASLKNEPGFIILCDALQASVDDIADAIGETQNPAFERRLIDHWKIARRFLQIMRIVPEGAIAELEDSVTKVRTSEEYNPRPTNAVDKLRAFYTQQGMIPPANLP